MRACYPFLSPSVRFRVLLNLVALSFALITTCANASPTSPIEGAEYTMLSTPQGTTSAGRKVEVIEFFMYHCPACYALEPQLLNWIKKQGDNIQFKRIHLPHRGEDDVEAHLFLTLEALNLEGSMHAKILQYWHVQHHQLTTDEDNIDWAVSNGIDKTQFVTTYRSFSVLSKLHGLLRLAQSYQVTSTPTLVIDGRFVTDPGLIQNSNPTVPAADLDQAMLQVADWLVLKAQAGK